MALVAAALAGTTLGACGSPSTLLPKSKVTGLPAHFAAWCALQPGDTSAAARSAMKVAPSTGGPGDVVGFTVPPGGTYLEWSSWREWLVAIVVGGRVQSLHAVGMSASELGCSTNRG